MAATMVKQNLWPVGEWCMHGYWGKGVLQCWIFMWVWLIKKWFGAYKKFQLLSNTWSWRYGYWNTRQRQQTRGPVCERICSTEKGIEEWNCSWDFADFEPFNEDMIDNINRCLLPLVHSNEQAIVPDIYMPEILLHIIAEVEETNRLLFLSQIFVRMLFIQERQNGSKELCCLDF